MDFLNDAYFSYYVFSGKCLYDGLIRAMTLIVFLQISPYDAYYVYDAYSGVESMLILVFALCSLTLTPILGANFVKVFKF